MSKYSKRYLVIKIKMSHEYKMKMHWKR